MKGNSIKIETHGLKSKTHGDAITSPCEKPNENIKKGINKKKERKSLKSQLTTLLIEWTLMLSPIV